jgi:hypothetical protein
MAGCPTAGIPARLCGDLVEGGYSDWYLPSQQELERIYPNKVAIGVYANVPYWTSTSGSANFASAINFLNGTGLGDNKSNSYRAKAIRSF